MRAASLAALHHPTTLVFLVVVLAGLVMGYARAAPPLSSNELALLAAVSLVYLFVGTVVFIYVLESRTAPQRIAYLAFQIPLGLLLLILSRGNGWLLMLPLASHSVALFSPREAALPCVLITLGIAWNTSRFMQDWLPFLQSALVFGSAVLFAAVFTEISIRDARRREVIERLAAQLEAANRELQRYAVQAQDLAAAQERMRLAREIHDGLGHYLTAMSVQARLIDALLAQDPARLPAALDKLQAMIAEALADVRRSVGALRGEPTLGKPLLEALALLLDEGRAAGLQAELRLNGVMRPLPPAHELVLYRAAQEALTNIQKHAQAQIVRLALDYQPGEVVLQVQDDGLGCASDLERGQVSAGRYGLFGLRERLGCLGGSLEIHTAPGQGFTLTARLPEAPV